MHFYQGSIFSELVEEISRTIGENVIFTNELGKIIASTESNRIGDFHEGSKLAMEQRRYMHMTEHHAKKLEGVRKGVVTPIYIDDNPIGVVGITGDPRRIEPFILVVQRLAELFIKSSVDQMAKERYLRNLELFVFDWLNHSIPMEELNKYSDFYSINLSFYRQAMLFYTPEVPSLASNDVERLRHLWDREGDAIIIRWGQGKLLLIDCFRDRQQLNVKLPQFIEVASSLLGNEVFVGVGQEADYTKLSQSMEQAEIALNLAEKKRYIIFEEDLLFEYIHHNLDEPVKEMLIKRMVEPILHDSDLVNTLQVWLHLRMKAEQTAKALHIHKNTLYYRLQKIETLTKKNLDNMHDIVLLYLALQFNKEQNEKR